MNEFVIAVDAQADRQMTPEELASAVRSGQARIVSATLAPPAPKPRRGLGDIVAAGLASIGITKERVAQVTGKPCGCAKRQAALNRLGEKLGLPPGQS